MSQDDSKQSIDNHSQMPIDNKYFNNIINNLGLNINENNSNGKIILNNIISNASNSNKNFTDNNQQKNTLSSNNSNDFKSTENNPNSYFLLLYKEIISLIEETNTNFNYYLNEYNKIKNILNDNNIKYESITNIFKNSIIKIINEKTKEIMEILKQCKSTILLLEKDNRFYIQQNFLKQTKIDILENEIDSYIEMEEEFDEMKEKLKYENGKFLHNEKKENEILILRAENSNLKKVIDKNEKTIEEKEHIIETIKKKSASMLNTNNNTIKNSIDLNEIEYNHPSSLIFVQNSKKSKFSYNKENITNFKSYNIIQKIKSPINNNYKTSNISQSSKKINLAENNNNYSKSKKNNLTSRASTKELISKKIKNKVLNMKKIRRINESCLDNYNKSSAHITNSIMSSNSNNSNNKRLKKNINSFFKSNKNNIFNGINRIHKKLSSRLTNSNKNNLLKNNNNKIVVNSILDNNNNITNNNNNSFFFKTTRKKFGISKKNIKKMFKNTKEDYLLIRNNHSLIKSPTTFNNNDFDNNVGMKNNIIINNIIQNSTSVPISAVTSKSKEKVDVYENELSQNIKNDINNNKFSNIYIKKEKNNKNKLSGQASNIKKKNN